MLGFTLFFSLFIQPSCKLGNVEEEEMLWYRISILSELIRKKIKYFLLKGTIFISSLSFLYYYLIRIKHFLFFNRFILELKAFCTCSFDCFPKNKTVVKKNIKKIS